MPYIGKPQSADPITVNTSNIDDGTFQAVDISSSFREHISGSFQGGGSNKISGSLTSTGSFGKVEVGSGKITTAGNMTLDADGAQIRFEDGGTEFGRISRVSSDLVIKSISNNNDILFKGVDGSATITALTLDMSEAGNATFNSGITATTGTITGDFSVGGTITAQEVHTEFESASVIFTSGSTIFGNSSDDIHNMTGSLNVSGGLDVDGTTNLDVVDIDGAVDMASTLTLGGRLTLSNAGSDPGIFLGGGWQIFDNASESFGTAGDLVFYHGASRMVIGDTGDVGIGTNNPQTGRLHIHNGDSGATSYVQLTQDGTGTSGTNGLLVGVNAAEASIIYNGEDTPLIFYTNASERVRIDNSGKVGIGSTSPAGLIDVMGDSGYAYFTTTSPAAFNMIFRSGSADPQNNWLGQIEFTGASSGTSQIVTRNNNALALGVNNSHKLTLETNNDITVESGDIVFGSSGRGIVLGNTSNADANTLDDYEEGVWTPVPYYQNSGDQTVAENNDSNALGRYVIVGRQITLWAAVTYDMSSLGGITFDNIGIKNLPVSTANITNYRAVGCFQYSGNNASDEDTTFTISMGPNNNSMHISHQDGTGNQAQSFGNGSSISLFGTITFLLP